MQQKPVDVRTAWYFPTPLKIIGGLMVFWAILIVQRDYLTAPILFICGAALITTQYRFSIDPQNKTFREYLWILGFKKGATKPYDKVRKVFLKKNKVVQNMNLQAVSSSIHKEEYDGFILFSDDHKIHIGTNNKKQEFSKKLKSLAEVLKTNYQES